MCGVLTLEARGFTTRALERLVMLCVSKVTTVRSSRESAGLKLSRRRMMMMARPGDESETNSRGVY